MRSFKAASSTLSPSWMSMARLAFPSRLELNRPEGSFNAAPLANVILTTFLYVSPVQTMPPWEKMGVPIHFHSSTISGSASCMISRTFASVFPRQSPSSLILSSMNAEADSTGTGIFMYSSNSRTYFSCAQRNLQPPQVEASSGSIAVRKDGGNPRAGAGGPPAILGLYAQLQEGHPPPHAGCHHHSVLLSNQKIDRKSTRLNSSHSQMSYPV